MLVPSGRDPRKMEEFQRRIERFEERQAAARARNVEAQRRTRIFVVAVIAALLLTAGISAYIAYTLRALRDTVETQLHSAEAALTASNERWRDTRQALADNRSALQASEATLAKFRAETRVSLLLPAVDRRVDQLRDSGRVEFADDAQAEAVAVRLKQIVQPMILRQLTQNPDASDAELTAQIDKVVDARTPALLRSVR